MSSFSLIFITGLIILIVAIILNILANFLHIETWYSFLMKIQELGFYKTISDYWKHLFFLLFIYPLCLGLSAYCVIMFFKK